MILFGEELRKNKNDRPRVESFSWGIFLIFIGLLFLFNSLGILSWDVWASVWKLWPILIIFAGIKIILGENIFSELLATFILLAIFSTLLVYLFSQNSPAVVSSFPKEIVNFSKIWEVIGR